MRAADCDVAIIGAGPYGLSAAAHLHAADGLHVRVLGEPMLFWDQHMPRGMFLRSPYVASSIADPKRELTLDSYESVSRQQLVRPVGLEQFVDYGRWFRHQVLAEVDTRQVARVEANGGGFRLELEDGTFLHAVRVVVAAGIAPFAWRPPLLRELPGQASHSSEHRDLSSFRGRRVVVVGGGQSALESAALLHEAGAEVEVLVRATRIYFLRRVPKLHKLGPLTRLLFAPAEVGPAGISRIVSAPNWYRRLPRGVQDRFSVRSLRPAGAAWLAPRLEQTSISVGRSIVSVRPAGDRLELALDDGTRRICDHVLLATGYRVDIAAYQFLPAELTARIDRVGGYPRLTRGFETSLPGLHILGAPSAWSFGPLMRFVAGTEFAAPALAVAIVGRRRKRVRR
jgi:FAD-dependent urate hydroxylase